MVPDSPAGGRAQQRAEAISQAGIGALGPAPYPISEATFRAYVADALGAGTYVSVWVPGTGLVFMTMGWIRQQLEEQLALCISPELPE